jgi:hypothetical protein
MTCGSHLAAREREGAGYRFGKGCCWAVGRLRSWAETFPRVHFHVFISSLLFLFLISFISFARMLQINSNQFLKFYKIQNSPFKTVNNKFPKSNMVLSKASYA